LLRRSPARSLRPAMDAPAPTTRTSRLVHAIEVVSTWSGKLFAWLVIVLMLVVCVEVFKRYILNAPTAWIFDLNSMLYGSLFMLCGAYTLAHDGHVRGDFLYGRWRPRTQAALDLALYILFFIPGILALIKSGVDFASISWKINEHSNVTSEGPPLYHFKAVIPVAGALVMLQGLSEVLRCIQCLRTGVWPERIKDVEEIDVVEEQLAQSQFVDEESRKVAGDVEHINEAARSRTLDK